MVLSTLGRAEKNISVGSSENAIKNYNLVHTKQKKLEYTLSKFPFRDVGVNEEENSLRLIRTSCIDHLFDLKFNLYAKDGGKSAKAFANRKLKII